MNNLENRIFNFAKFKATFFQYRYLDESLEEFLNFINTFYINNNFTSENELNDAVIGPSPCNTKRK